MTEATEDDDVVWSATVDQGTWDAKVIPIETNTYRGTLIVTRISDNKEILNEEVGLSFQAVFGPDVDDVRLWAQMVTGAIDHYWAQHPEEKEAETT
jgi:hypothetical protein